jgi:two-component system sensor histidine kinase/response regulator
LAGNAVKFTSGGEIVISVTATAQSEEYVSLEFSVRDTGIGMDEIQLKNLFSSFSQADASTTRKSGGTGLGLTISKQLVTLMGGDIHVESALGKGSHFRFTIEFELDAGFALEDQPTYGYLVGKRILIVDDNAVARQILT